MRKIVGILVQPLVSYFLQLIYMYCAFPCIHNSSINVYAQHCHALYVLSTFLHWLHVTVEYGMSWKRYECAVNDCFATLKPPHRQQNVASSRLLQKVLAHSITIHLCPPFLTLAQQVFKNTLTF